MVFCYKIITESPRRSGCVSPRKKSPTNNIIQNVPDSLSLLLGSLEYDSNSTDILDSIPEREWKLLAALARKREEDDEREKLADQFRRMWQKEKEEREMVEAETNMQYTRYITKKRRDEQSWHDYKQYQKSLELQLKRQQLLDCIKEKEERSAEVLAWIDDHKANTMVDRALEDEARALLAADRRSRIGEAEDFRRRVQLIDTQKKSDDAGKRRRAMLKDASRRLAISNALSTWESSLVRREVFALDTARRAQHAASAALTDARSASLARARDARKRRARKLAAVTQQLREAIRSGRRS
ncbi:unnamed protein product [Arctia plantaginis]|uniref:Uncharacterized protein n=1 Tax=Arctia plantaginis TaxID=874455 RepID=A0A8S0YM81_ARCPL|nr:unnamed protein product [Arctia plantaginis]CAB3246025.1 unnamed protein product [Arctia plantaginis]